MLLWEKLAQADQKPINSQCELEIRKIREDKYTETSLSHGSHDRRTRLLPCASLVAQMVKNLPAMQETWVRSLGWEDPLKKGMETHSSILACRIPWTEEPGGPQSKGSPRVRHDWVTNIFIFQDQKTSKWTKYITCGQRGEEQSLWSLKFLCTNC